MSPTADSTGDVLQSAAVVEVEAAAVAAVAAAGTVAVAEQETSFRLPEAVTTVDVTALALPETATSAWGDPSETAPLAQVMHRDGGTELVLVEATRLNPTDEILPQAAFISVINPMIQHTQVLRPPGAPHQHTGLGGFFERSGS